MELSTRPAASQSHPVGANTYSWMWQVPVQPCLERLRALGFDQVELMTMPGHFWPDELGAGQRAQLRDWMEGEGISARSINHPGVDQNLSSPVPGMRQFTVDFLRRVIQLAADLRCPHVIVVMGRVNPLLPAPRERYFDWAYESIRQLLPLAEDLGVRLAVENIPIGPAPLAGQVVEMVRRLASPAARICYDTANAHFVGEDLAAGLREVAPWLDLLHLADTGRDKWRHDVIGTGSVDFRAVLEAAREIGHVAKPLLELCTSDPEAGHRTSVERLAGLP
jgi:sugar phosphate isomerase/epimerase